MIYSADKPQMVLRCLVSLADVDGVTALRVALHALELVEGNPKISNHLAFTKLPPYTYGWRQRVNFASVMFSIFTSIAGATLFGSFMDKQGAAKRIGAPAGTVVPNSAVSTIEYYKPGAAAEPAAYNLYADNAATASQKPYKRFLDAMEAWREALGIHSFFVLISAAPLVIPAQLKHARDVLDIEKKYACAIDKPTVGAREKGSEEPWGSEAERLFHCSTD